MLERAPELAVLLCFDVKVDSDAEEVANDMGVKIFSANIIYHLFDSFTAYQKALPKWCLNLISRIFSNRRERKLLEAQYSLASSGSSKFSVLATPLFSGRTLLRVASA
jgi:translation initiation factor IF-2